MEQQEIRAELCKAVDGSNAWQSLGQLMLRLRKENPETVTRALLGVFFDDSRTKTRFRDQQAAGGILWKLKPKYKGNLREDIRSSLKNWNVSVEELPWYFAEIMGIDRVRDEVNSILRETLDEISRKKAQTYLYWLPAKNTEGRKARLNQIWNGRLRG
jgi:hypothetical protein